jgi:hypothetical protein
MVALPMQGWAITMIRITLTMNLMIYMTSYRVDEETIEEIIRDRSISDVD